MQLPPKKEPIITQTARSRSASRQASSLESVVCARRAVAVHLLDGARALQGARRSRAVRGGGSHCRVEELQGARVQPSRAGGAGEGPRARLTSLHCIDGGKIGSLLQFCSQRTAAFFSPNVVFWRRRVVDSACLDRRALECVPARERRSDQKASS